MLRLRLEQLQPLLCQRQRLGSLLMQHTLLLTDCFLLCQLGLQQLLARLGCIQSLLLLLAGFFQLLTTAIQLVEPTFFVARKLLHQSLTLLRSRLQLCAVLLAFGFTLRLQRIGIGMQLGDHGIALLHLQL